MPTSCNHSCSGDSNSTRPLVTPYVENKTDQPRGLNGAILSLKGYVAMPEHIFGCHNLGRGRGVGGVADI